MFTFVEIDMFVGVVWNEDVDICFPFDVMDSINNVYIGVFHLLMK